MINAGAALRRVSVTCRVRLASQEEQINRSKGHGGYASISSHNRYLSAQRKSEERKRTDTAGRLKEKVDGRGTGEGKDYWIHLDRRSIRDRASERADSPLIPTAWGVFWLKGVSQSVSVRRHGFTIDVTPAWQQIRRTLNPPRSAKPTCGLLYAIETGTSNETLA